MAGDISEEVQEALRDLRNGKHPIVIGPSPNSSVHIVNPVAALLAGLPPGTVVKFEIHFPGKDAVRSNRLHVDRWPAPTPDQIRERMTTSPGKDAE